MLSCIFALSLYQNLQVSIPLKKRHLSAKVFFSSQFQILVIVEYELHKPFFRLFFFLDKALVCVFDKTWWNEAHQNTFSLSSLFYYSKYNRDHCACEVS